MKSAILQTMFTEGWRLGLPVGVMSEENDQGISFACVGYIIDADHSCLKLESKDRTCQWVIELPPNGKREIIPHDLRKWTIHAGSKRILIAQDLEFCQKAMFLLKMQTLATCLPEVQLIH